MQRCSAQSELRIVFKVGALAVGGVLAVGAGVYLLGGAGAMSATANGLSSVGDAAAG